LALDHILLAAAVAAKSASPSAVTAARRGAAAAGPGRQPLQEEPHEKRIATKIAVV
jgi:hypothetical protein